MAADTTPGMGLLGMRERVRALGGVVAIGNAPNGGAIVEALFDAIGTKSRICREFAIDFIGINEVNEVAKIV